MYKKIVVALSFEQRVDAKLHKRVQEIVSANKAAKVHLVHAVEQVVAMGLAFGLSVTPELEADLKEDAEKNMQKQSAVFKSSSAHVQLGAARDVILEQASQLNADLIVIGSHVQTGLNLLLGSTANAICQSAHCDVLAVRTESE